MLMLKYMWLILPSSAGNIYVEFETVVMCGYDVLAMSHVRKTTEIKIILYVLSSWT
jgi:hypothetical protein